MQFLGYDYAFPITIESNTGETVNETQSLRVTVTSIGAHRWELSIGLTPVKMPSNQMGILTAHRVKHGYINPFMIPFPQTVDAVLTGAVANVAEVDVGDDVIHIPTSAVDAGRVVEGRAIKFANHPKVYMITSVYKDGGGNNAGRIEIDPPSLIDLNANAGQIDRMPDLRAVYAPDSLAAFGGGNDSLFRPRLDVIEYLG